MSETRVEQWKRKLLDLSLRNPLLNVRDGNRFLLLVKGAPYGGGAASTEVVPYGTAESGESLPFRSDLPETEIKKRLKELYLASRSMQRESGVNSLFMAVGFLNWREAEDEEYHRAPLVLIPAQMVRQTASPGYRATRTDEDAVASSHSARWRRGVLA